MFVLGSLAILLSLSYVEGCMKTVPSEGTTLPPPLSTTTHASTTSKPTESSTTPATTSSSTTASSTSSTSTTTMSTTTTMETTTTEFDECGQWGAWSACYPSCGGGGVAIRSRVPPAGVDDCPKNDMMECGAQLCVSGAPCNTDYMPGKDENGADVCVFAPGGGGGGSVPGFR